MTMPPSTMTIESALQQGINQLMDSDPQQAESIALWALVDCVGMNRGLLLASRHQPLTDEQYHRWTALLGKLVAGVPLQYALGNTDFMGLTLACDDRALIPRPETEQLVDWVVKDSGSWNIPEPRLADVGTGTGCIALAIAHALPSAQIWAVDASLQALDLARENARSFGLQDRIVWQEGHVAEELKAKNLHAIVSNPPYISESDWQELASGVRDREPKQALVSGQDGLDCIRDLISSSVNALAPAGRLFMEIGETQETMISELLTRHRFVDIEFKKDFAGRTRFVRATTAP